MSMNARELVELAALLSQHGGVIISGQFQIGGDSLEQYWVASKCRLDRWLRALQPRLADQDTHAPRGELLAGIVEEIFTTEVLTRIWTAILAARGPLHGQSDAEMIARSVLLSHMEARNRALKLLLHGTRIPPEQAVELNRLRRRSERWSDVLIGRLLPTADVAMFAADGNRAREFALDMHYQASLISEAQVWGLLMASLRATFQQSISSASPNADLNERVAAGVISSLGPQIYSTSGELQSLKFFRWYHEFDDKRTGDAALFASEKLYPQKETPPATIDPPEAGRLPSWPRF